MFTFDYNTGTYVPIKRNYGTMSGEKEDQYPNKRQKIADPEYDILADKPYHTWWQKLINNFAIMKFVPR